MQALLRKDRINNFLEALAHFLIVSQSLHHCDLAGDAGRDAGAHQSPGINE